MVNSDNIVQQSNTHNLQTQEISSPKLEVLNSYSAHQIHSSDDADQLTSQQNDEIQRSSIQRKPSMLNGMISIKDFGYHVDHILHHIVLNGEQDYKHHLIQNDEDDYDEEEEEYDDDDDEYNDLDDGEDTAHSYDYYNSYNENDNEYEGVDTQVTGDSRIRETNEDQDEDEEKGEGAGLQAIALYSFSPENQNELALEPHQIVIINYDYGDGWLVAFDPVTEKTGFVPENYVHIVNDSEELEELLHELQSAGHEGEEEDEEEEAEYQDCEGDEEGDGVGQYDGDLVTHEETATARPFLPGIFQDALMKQPESPEDDDWVDEEEEEEEEEEEDDEEVKGEGSGSDTETEPVIENQGKKMEDIASKVGEMNIK